MKICFIITTTAILSMLQTNSRAQIPLTLPLKSALEIAKKNSLDYKIALTTIKSSYWNYVSYKSGRLPKLSLNATLPDYYRSINLIPIPNGQVAFIGQDAAYSSAELDFAQPIWLTGGNMSVGTSLSRIDNIGQSGSTYYTSVPFSWSYRQDNLFYNSYKWQRKIESLKLMEAQRGYLENLEDISYSAVNHYFDLLLANTQLRLDRQNLENIDTLTKITQARFGIGTAQLNDVLQAKVSLLNAKRAVANSVLSKETAEESLIRYLNMTKGEKLELQLPDSVIFFEVNPDVALAKAQGNRKFIIEFQRKRLEAEQAVAITRSATGPSVGVMANIGVTKTGSVISQSYAELLRTQSLKIVLSIPLMNWGENRSKRKQAEADLELEKNNIAQQQLSAEQEIYYEVLKWGMQKDQIEISREASSLSQQRYEIAFQKYSLGTITFTDFNNAQLDKDRAVIDYINNLRNYWSLYFLIRRLTLFDFEKNKNIAMADLIFD